MFFYCVVMDFFTYIKIFICNNVLNQISLYTELLKVYHTVVT